MDFVTSLQVYASVVTLTVLRRYVQGHGKALGTVSGASLRRKITNTSVMLIYVNQKNL